VYNRFHRGEWITWASGGGGGPGHSWAHKNHRSINSYNLLLSVLNKILNLQAHYEERYIPDPFIESLRKELAEDEEKREAVKADKEASAAARAARKQAELLKSLT
jgi:hypothetical protein